MTTMIVDPREPTLDRMVSADVPEAYEPSRLLEFLCLELDDIRTQLAKATAHLAMMGIPEPPAEGWHVHSKRFSGMSYNGELAWICSECLEQGCDYPQPTGPTYDELLAKKRSGG